MIQLKSFSKFAWLLLLGVCAVVVPVRAGDDGCQVEPCAAPRVFPAAPAAASDYIEVFEGDMPLLFAVGHGGWEDVGSLPNSGPPWENDVLVQEYFYQVLLLKIYEKTGHLPYYVFMQGKRNYVNTNREVGNPEGYNADNDEAREAYFGFHDQVDTVIGLIESNYGADMALMINPHSADLAASRHGKPWDRIMDIGFGAYLSNLGSGGNTMKALYDRRGDAALIGEDSIPYQVFHANEWPDASAVWPAVATNNPKTLARDGLDVWHVLPAYVSGWGTDDWVDCYYTGRTTIKYHGTNTSGRYTGTAADWPNGLDAFQMEIDYPADSGLGDEDEWWRLDTEFVDRLIDDLADAILYSLQVNYGWTPGGVYNVVVDNGDANFGVTGAWEESGGEGSWGVRSVWSNEVGATATWTPNLAQGGTYKVFIRWTDYENRTTNAQYTVNYAGGSRNFAVDQSGVTSAKWVSLGQFEFNAGTGGNVVLACSDSDTSTAADAVLFCLNAIEYDHFVYLPAITKP